MALLNKRAVCGEERRIQDDHNEIERILQSFTKMIVFIKIIVVIYRSIDTFRMEMCCCLTDSRHFIGQV